VLVAAEVSCRRKAAVAAVVVAAAPAQLFKAEVRSSTTALSRGAPGEAVGLAHHLVSATVAQAELAERVFHLPVPVR
jgi:hypothetical protein